MVGEHEGGGGKHVGEINSSDWLEEMGGLCGGGSRFYHREKVARGGSFDGRLLGFGESLGFWTKMTTNCRRKNRLIWPRRFGGGKRGKMFWFWSIPADSYLILMGLVVPEGKRGQKHETISYLRKKIVQINVQSKVAKWQQQKNEGFRCCQSL